MKRVSVFGVFFFFKNMSFKIAMSGRVGWNWVDGWVSGIGYWPRFTFRLTFLKNPSIMLLGVFSCLILRAHCLGYVLQCFVQVSVPS